MMIRTLPPERHPDDSEIVGDLWKPVYRGWLIGKPDGRYVVRERPESEGKQWNDRLEWHDGRRWRKLPPNTVFIVE